MAGHECLGKGFVSRYAVGRDYHRIIRSRLAKLANRIRRELGLGNLGHLSTAPPYSNAPLPNNQVLAG